MFSRSIRFWFLAASALSLISCTVNKHPDSWEHKVRAEWVENRKVHSEELTALTAPTVPVDAKLVFDGTEIKSGSFKTSCTSVVPSITRAKREGKFSASSVTIATLLPKEIWLQVGWTNDATIDCAIEFSVTNSHDSTWSFKVSQMTVKRLDQLVNMRALKPGEGEFSLDEQPMIFDGIAETPPGETTIDLVCQKFRNTRTVTEATTITKVTRDLRYGSIPQKLEDFDFRDTYQSQKCQFLMESKDSEGIVTQRLSQTFDLKFAPPAIKYKVSPLALPLAEGAAESSHARVLEISIENLSHRPQQFQLAQADGNNLSLIGILSFPDNQKYMGSLVKQAHLEFKAAGGKLVSNDQTTPIYEIEAGSTLHFYAEIQIGYHCVFATDQPIPGVDKYRSFGGLMVGNLYYFSAGKLVNVVRHHLEGAETFEALDDSNSVGFSASKPAWAPIESWRIDHGSEPAAPIISSDSDICAPKGQQFNLHVLGS